MTYIVSSGTLNPTIPCSVFVLWFVDVLCDDSCVYYRAAEVKQSDDTSSSVAASPTAVQTNTVSV